MLPKLILVFLSVDWPIFSRRPMLTALAEAAKTYSTTVVAINRPLCPISTLFRKPRRFVDLMKNPELRQVAPNLYLYSPKYFLHDSIANRSRISEGLNVFALRRSLSALQKRLTIEEPAPIVWFYYPQQGYVSKINDRSFCVFELYDNLTDVFGVSDTRALTCEAKWRPHVDLFLATSPCLQRRFGAGYKNSHYLKNGLSRAAYELLPQRRSSRSRAYEYIPAPRLGYAGVISERLDWNLICDLSEARPDWNFVFAGRVTHRRYMDLVSARENIYYIGEFSQEQVPSIVAEFDIGIMPYLDNEFFRFSNPLKFYELCAAEIPSVSSPMEILMQFPPEIVTVCGNDTVEWVNAIQSKLNEYNASIARACRQTAQEHIWEDITNTLFGELEEYFTDGLSVRGPCARDIALRA